jgi:hypothetical protein
MSDRTTADSSVEILHTSSALVEATKAQGVAETVASLAVAKRFPRDDTAVWGAVTRTCQRRSLAEIAQYEYARGGTTIAGPSVHLIRAIAAHYGNLKYGWDELERRPGESTCAAYAWDQQSNTRAERKFIIKHFRDTKGGGYVLKDERDIYELLANQSARRVRSCLQEVIPQDLVEMAVVECEKTMTSGQKVPLADRVRQAMASLAEFGISRAQIEDKFQKKAEALTEADLAKLRRIFTALKDGVATPTDHFKDEVAITVESSARNRMKPAVKSEGADDVPYTEPASPSTATEPGPELTPQAALQKFVTEECAKSLDVLKETLTRSGFIKSMKSVEDAASFDEISSADCAKLLGARRGLATQLKGGQA